MILVVVGCRELCCTIAREVGQGEQS